MPLVLIALSGHFFQAVHDKTIHFVALTQLGNHRNWICFSLCENWELSCEVSDNFISGLWCFWTHWTVTNYFQFISREHFDVIATTIFFFLVKLQNLKQKLWLCNN